MPQFKKKPVTIEAVQWTGDLAPIFRMIPEGAESPFSLSGQTLKIWTAEGEMTASLHDWIIKGIRGEFYACKPDIFAATYEAIVDKAVES